MNRVRFYHDEYPLFFDLSIVRNSKKMNKVTVPKYTIQEADVFNNVEHYEIEIEVDNTKVGINNMRTICVEELVESQCKCFYTNQKQHLLQEPLLLERH